ncbi:MAG TPA: hypothetical protein VIQ62_07665 [Burkholderiales bacterium]|jgi:hypothetical protein
MCTATLHRFACRNPVNAAVCALGLIALTLYCDGALAEQRPRPASPELLQPHFTDLERAFWACDYVGTTQGVSAAPVAACSAITDALKKAKFGGDFHQMLTWWKRNKQAEHEELARSAR